jgi:peptidoglycan-associated lipoprotein
MNKLLALILPLLLVGLIVGCGGKQQVMPPDVKTPTEQPPEVTEETTINETPEVEEAAPKFVSVYFDTDKWFLRDDAKHGLQQDVQIMQQHPDLKVQIQGNCDERNTEDYNLALGEKRARSAYDYMVSLGIPADRLSIITYGETRPVALGHNEEAWRQNRRCDLVVVN